jgi:hypothetical protein
MRTVWQVHGKRLWLERRFVPTFRRRGSSLVVLQALQPYMGMQAAEHILAIQRRILGPPWQSWGDAQRSDRRLSLGEQAGKKPEGRERTREARSRPRAAAHREGMRGGAHA